ncbi:MAG: hypothetical protein KBC12_00900 [Candidatus Pacebacteria bacterium]|nr:hypothetical protein [Candidatus Paceibacterota bacterium]
MENLPFANLPLEHLSPAWFVLIAIFANAFPPVPEEIFLLYFGYMANLKPEVISFTQINFFLIVGFLAVDSVVYYLAKRGHRIITFILNKILDVDIDQKQDFLKRHVNKIIFISRFLVQLRALGPITAARVGLPFKQFLKIDFLALCVYVPTVLGLGYYFAHSLEKVLSGSKAFHSLMFTGLIVLAFIIVMRRLRKVLLSEFSTEAMNKIKSSYGMISKWIK